MLYNNNTNNFALALIKYTKHCRSSKNRKNLLYTMRSHLYLEKTFDSTLSTTSRILFVSLLLFQYLYICQYVYDRSACHNNCGAKCGE